MSGRVAILTPDRHSAGFDTRWPDVLEREAAPLRAAGLEVEGRDWAHAQDLGDFDLVLPLLAWGYPFAPEQWVEATGRWEAQGVGIENPPAVLRWNADKAYLGTLAARGAPVVPTRYVERVSEGAMAAAAEAFGTERLVAKPRISSSGWQTIRWSPGDSLEEGPDGAAMIQPYLPDVEQGGEVSLFHFAGRYSHAVSKRPQPGEFRVQPEFDGIIRACAPAADEREAAERVLAAAGGPLLYARIDLVRGPGGAPLLVELELIEPDLYLGYAPDRGAAFAAAVQERIAAR
ncbi:MAG: RimK family alpha-L-glutamate ligase [Allosphingosinicella sp.]